jgi:hypothetical protein
MQIDETAMISVDTSFSNFIGGVVGAAGGPATVGTAGGVTKSPSFATRPGVTGHVEGWIQYDHMTKYDNGEPWRKMPRQLGDFRVVDIPVSDGGHVGNAFIEVKVVCAAECVG